MEMFFYIILASSADLPMPLPQMVFDGSQRVNVNFGQLNTLIYSTDEKEIAKVLKDFFPSNNGKPDLLVNLLLNEKSFEIRKVIVKRIVDSVISINKKVECISNNSDDGMNVSDNSHYTLIMLLEVVRNSQLKILDVGSGNGTLLEFLSARWGKDAKITYKAVERNSKMREDLDKLSDRVKKQSPNVRLIKTTEKGKDFFDYVNITNDYESPYEVVNAQLFLHYCSPKQWGVFFKKLRDLLTEDGRMYISVQVNPDEKKRDQIVWTKHIGQPTEIKYSCDATASFMEVIIEAYGWKIFSNSLHTIMLATGPESGIYCIQMVLVKSSFIETRAKIMDKFLQQIEDELEISDDNGVAVPNKTSLSLQKRLLEIQR